MFCLSIRLTESFVHRITHVAPSASSWVISVAFGKTSLGRDGVVHETDSLRFLSLDQRTAHQELLGARNSDQ
jgi:hypothetical protein